MSILLINQNSIYSQTPIVPNGSFEIYTRLPYFANDSGGCTHSDFSAAGNDTSLFGCILYSWINRCFQCTYPDRIHRPEPNNCSGWFTPTFSSPDYFNKSAPSNAIHIRPRDFYLAGGSNTESRQPYPFPPNVPDAYKAFVGISLLDPETLTQNDKMSGYREFVETRLNSTLLKNRWYRVSFRASRSASSTVKGHIRKLGAYLSQNIAQNLIDLDTTVQPNKESISINFGAICENNKPDVYVKPQVVGKIPLDSTAIQNPNDSNRGKGYWYEICDTVEGNNYNYITIGCFENVMNDFVFLTPSNVSQRDKQTYYFIDNVKIVDITPDTSCLCGSGVYKFSVSPLKAQSDATKCCYVFNLTVPIDSNNVVCPLTGVTIKYMWADSILTVYQHDQQIYKGTTLVDTFCVEKIIGANAVGYPNIEVIYHTPTRDCSEQIAVTCECRCGREDGKATDDFGDLRKKITFEPSDSVDEYGKCCFDIWFKNDGCHYRSTELKYMALHPINNTHAYYQNGKHYWYAGMDFVSGVWNADSTLDSNSFKYFLRPNSEYIFPLDSIYLGTICIPQDGHDYIFIRRIGEWEPSPNNENFCLSQDTIHLSCSTPPQNCCDSYHVVVINSGIDSLSEVFYTINYTKGNHNCDVYSIKFFSPSDTVIPIWQYPPITPSKPLYTGPQYNFLKMMGKYGFPFATVCFYDKYGFKICCKAVEIY